MTESSSKSARAEILERIRTALGKSAGGSRPDPSPPPVLDRPRAATTQKERIQKFCDELRSVGGQAQVATDIGHARKILGQLSADLGFRELALSDHPLVRAVASELTGVRCFEGWTDRKRLFACDAGLTSVQRAIAETGTLVLESSAEHHRIVSLVPPVHLVLMSARDLVSGMDEALASLPGGKDGPTDRCISFITGPSRTGDIEMKLVIGVHGPRVLHVIVIEEIEE